MTESIKGRKKINRNRITLDFKCAICDYAMRESHNILESSTLDIMNILDAWKEGIEDHKDSCIDKALEGLTHGIPKYKLDDILPIDEAIPLTPIQEG